MDKISLERLFSACLGTGPLQGLSTASIKALAILTRPLRLFKPRNLILRQGRKECHLFDETILLTGAPLPVLGAGLPRA